MNKDENWILLLENNINISYPKDWNSECFQIEDNSFWFIHRARIILFYIKKYFWKEISFCDIWWWNAYTTSIIHDYIKNTTILEPWYEWCLNAKKRWISHIICWILDDKFDKQYDLIWIFDVLEHIRNTKNFLNNIHKTLNKNWSLILTVPAFNFLWSYEDQKAGHFRRYDKQILINELSKSWFEIIEINYFFNCLVLPIFIFRKLFWFLFSKLSIKKQHKDNKIIMKFLNREYKNIEKWKKIYFGTSLICIARKIW